MASSENFVYIATDRIKHLKHGIEIDKKEREIYYYDTMFFLPVVF